jgi:hypothetical protein
VESRAASILLVDSDARKELVGFKFYVTLVSRMTANTKMPDARAIQATELIARLAPNKSAKKPMPIAPKTKPKSHQNL